MCWILILVERRKDLVRMMERMGGNRWLFVLLVEKGCLICEALMCGFLSLKLNDERRIYVV